MAKKDKEKPIAAVVEEEAAPAKGPPPPPAASAKDRLAAVLSSKTLAAVQKEHGGKVQTAGTYKVAIPRVPIGALPADLAFGGIGFPLGCIWHNYGPKAAGKTTTTLLLIAAVQRTCAGCLKLYTGKCCEKPRQMLAAYVDVEGVLDLGWAAKLGVNVDEMLYSRPGSAEEAADLVDFYLSGGLVDLVVLDSVAAMVPSAELDKTASEAVVGEQARCVHRMLRKAVGVINRQGVTTGLRPTLVCLNQPRNKVGVVFGNPETTAGGNGPPLMASIEVKFLSSAHTKAPGDDNGKPLYVTIRFRIEKNKTASGKGIEVEYRVMQRDTETKKEGDIYDEHTLIERAIDAGLLEGSGSSWNLMGKNYRGKSIIELELQKDLDLREQLRGAIYRVLSPES